MLSRFLDILLSHLVVNLWNIRVKKEDLSLFVIFEQKAGTSDCCYVSLVDFAKIESLVKVAHCFYSGSRRIFEENDFDSSSDEASAEIPVKQNQRKSRVKGTARKSGLSDQIIEFQNKQRQQICESEIRNQEFIKQLTTQQREKEARERERDRAFFLELSKILKD